jgi:hypothetical protein
VIPRCIRRRRAIKWQLGKSALRRQQPYQADPCDGRRTANVADSAVSPDLLHGDETRVWGDHAYRGRRADIRPGQIYRWRRVRIPASIPTGLATAVVKALSGR